MNPEKSGLHKGDGGPNWGRAEIAKTHFETITFYPFVLMFRPRATLLALRSGGLREIGRGYRRQYKIFAEMSAYWNPGGPDLGGGYL